MLNQDQRTEHFRQSMRRLASTVCVISCKRDGERYGITVTSVTPLSFSPISILTCVNKSASISAPLKDEGRYCINVLRASQADVSNSFSGSLPPKERFGVGEWAEMDGVPYLPNAQASLFCEIDQAISYATHDIIIGGVTAAYFAADIAPLIYQNGSYAVAAPLALQKAG
ncbi:flavin reductase family protein [Ancylobacter sonchi]|uniref:flavin reductase family protein n=1 Tax=Ancylobacter sonchi TaxID=1937790 RepID=UPI001BD3A2B0|nr:flavin reductase family protein [Ancylobacter sonchi]MBS7536018.1 flavin reductase family protein [Ancylobacter sonchi]